MFNLISLNTKDIEGLAILAVAGVAGWFLYQHMKTSQAASSNNAALAMGAVPNYGGSLANLAMLQQLGLLGSLGMTQSSTVPQTVSSSTVSNTSGGGSQNNPASSAPTAQPATSSTQLGATTQPGTV